MNEEIARILRGLSDAEILHWKYLFGYYPPNVSEMRIENLERLQVLTMLRPAAKQSEAA